MARFASGLCAMGLLLASGCGGESHPPTGRVTGAVTYRGQPVEGAQVTFFAQQGRPGSGVTDAQGKFVLSTFGSNDGAVPGEHVVVISKKESAPASAKNPYAPGRELLPKRYGDRGDSPLKATVAAGKANEFTFELKD